MRKLLLCLAGLLLINIAKAQYYYIPYPNQGENPGNLNSDGEYPVGGGLPATWTTIQGPSATPVWSAVQSIPFTFSFNGNPVTQFKVSTSGILTFDVASALPAPSYTRASLPDATVPDNSVCIWGLGGLGTNDNIVSKVFGNAPSRQLWILFSSYGYGTTASTGSAYTYWSIMLEEGSNKIYIVDQRTAGYATTKLVSAGIQIDASTAVAVAGSPNLQALATSNATPSDNSYYEFIYGTQVSYDVYVKNITTPSYLTVGANNITGTLRNIGTTTITSFDINYKINSGTAVTSTVSGVSIAPFSTFNFTSTIPWITTVAGPYNVECYATNLNSGNNDQNTTNDSYTKNIFILSEIVQRVPLFEVFTSSTCPPCQPGNVNFHNIIDTINPQQHVYVKHQQDFPGTGDPYTTIETLNRRAFYNINSIPRMENDGGWDGNANSFTYALYQAARAVPAQYKFGGFYNADTVNRTYSAKVLYSPLFPASNTKLYLGIIENTTYNNIKTNGETEFFQVLKKMLPDDGGITLPSIAVGTWDSVSVTYTFNGNYRLPADGQAQNIINLSTEHSVEEFSDLRIIGWVQNPSGDKQVYQAANLSNAAATGFSEMSKNIDAIRIAPNPASDFIHVEISLNQKEDVLIRLLNSEGKLIEMRNITHKDGFIKETIATDKLANGIYHLSVSDSKNNYFVKRIIIAH